MADAIAIDVRYFAAAADAAGKASETLSLPAEADLAALVDELSTRYGARFAEILGVSAFLVGDELTRDRTMACGPRVDVLPPFAGG